MRILQFVLDLVISTDYKLKKMSWLIYISFLIYITYTIVSVIKAKRIPDNLSDTYYLWPNSKWIFPAILISASITMAPAWWQYAQENNCEYLLFTMGIGIGMVSLIPDYKTNLWKFLTHIICAYTAGFAAALFLFLTNWIVIISAAIVALCIWLPFDKNRKTTFEFWLEFIVLSALYTLLMFNL